MAHNSLKRPSFGEIVPLGALYDARADSFLSDQLLQSLPPPSSILVTDKASTTVQLSESHTYYDKLALLGASPDLGASLLTGLITSKASTCFLTEDQGAESNLAVALSLRHCATTVHEKLNFGANEVKASINLSCLQQSQATHVVAEITYGFQNIVTSSYIRNPSQPGHEIRQYLHNQLAAMEDGILRGQVADPGSTPDRKPTDSISVLLYSDQVPSTKAHPTDFRSARDFLLNSRYHASKFNGGKGIPLTYTLLPVEWLSFIASIESPSTSQWVQPDADYLADFFGLLEDNIQVRKRLQDYWSYLARHKHLVPPQHLDEVTAQLNRAAAVTKEIKTQYGQLLYAVRSGKTPAKQLSGLIDSFRNGGSSPTSLLSVVDVYTRKLAFIDLMTSKGAGYFRDGQTLDLPKGNVYTLYFNRACMADTQLWNENSGLLEQLLDDNSSKKTIRMVDCDESSRKIQNVTVRYHRDRQLVTGDLRRLRQFLNDKCLMRFDDRHLDSWGVKKPLERKPMRLPCPASTCDPQAACSWICSRCYSPIDYGFQDGYMYCDCGRTQARCWAYRCNATHHGSDFMRYDNRHLSNLLKGLEPFEELNILILGETGVGKSTFVNAFVNYLAHESLDEAIQATDIEHVIPCSFATQTIDETDSQKKLVQTQIKIGSANDEEFDGSKGQSATQKTLTYPIFVGSTMIRLIDTPGIGDTRGVEQDRRNMADVLSVLRNYKELHGILVLLKPNNSRLNVMFKFCIKELLTHLHRNAAQNMVFGFTNTRGSNYNPGDTFKPLEALLSEYEDVNLGLFHDTVYCFDSESFRYLAAHKQGVNLGSFDDYVRSWEQSATESRRLLQHFRGLEPHQVKNTLSLNETRHMILQLTKPMAEIAQKIQDTISLNEQDAELLRNSKLSKVDMLQKLTIQQSSVVFTPVQRPKTVCSNAKCIEKVDTVGPNGEDTIHTSLCHDPCCLTNVPVEKVGTPELIECFAFNHTPNCLKCGHHWTEHKHILYEHKGTTRTIKDPKVEMLLKDNAQVTTVIEAAIKSKEAMIAEFKYEHREIQKAAVQFSLWLKRHSITPYNDATLEYLDHLIKEETSRVQVGGNRARLDAFEQYRREYQELVKVFQANIGRGSAEESMDAEGVDKLIKQLYSLKHYGQDLRKLRDVVVIAHAATYRERPYRVRWNRGYAIGYESMEPGSFEPIRISKTWERPRNPFGFLDRSRHSRHQSSGARDPYVDPYNEKAGYNEKTVYGEEVNEKGELQPEMSSPGQTITSAMAPPSYFEAAISPQHSGIGLHGRRSGSRSLSSKLSSRLSLLFK
ncbi:hypothetical protein B0A52_08624 [Exophiala mesophila]|uniref:Uncharacterized protein n=1 Tax=Exophiala mesophila TaxID=212818 RepID=A0A438MU00_EXOME|nr:hypothetical protein B0A52_08624 [Exophiala mesophila]